MRPLFTAWAATVGQLTRPHGTGEMRSEVKVRVTTKDIRGGICGDMFNCAVASALQRHCGKDDDAHVFESAFAGTKIKIGALVISAPWEVREFSRDYDDLPRDEYNRPILKKKLPEGIKPFTFELPPWDSSEWEEECYRCEALGSPSRLDDEGICSECRKRELS